MSTTPLVDEVRRIVYALPITDTEVHREGDRVIVSQPLHWGHNQMTSGALTRAGLLVDTHVRAGASRVSHQVRRAAEPKVLTSVFH